MKQLLHEIWNKFLFVFLHIPKFRGSLSIALAWNWARFGDSLLPLNQLHKFNFRTHKIFGSFASWVYAGLSSGELRQLGSLACFLESFVFWVALVKREIPRIMKTILIRMMKAVRMTRLRDEGASPEVIGHLTRLRKNSSHERCMTVSRLRR